MNLGRRNRYPYALATHVARAESNRTHWWREVYVLDIASAYELVLFVYLHELFHWLVMSAGRNENTVPGKRSGSSSRSDRMYRLVGR